VIRIAVLVVLCAASIPAAVLDVRLYEHVELQSVHAILGDVAELSGDPIVAAQAATVVVQAMRDTAAYTIGERQIRPQLLRQFPGVDLVITGTCIARRQIVEYDEATVSAQAEAHLRGRASDASVTLTVIRCSGPVRALKEPDRPLRLVADPLNANLWGEVPYRVRLMRGDHEEARSLVVLRVSAIRQVSVAARDLPRGHVLELHDLRLDDVVLNRSSGAVATPITDLIGRALRTTTHQGQVLTLTRTRPPIIVRSGSQVMVAIARAGFEVSVMGQSMSEGAMGERIRVRQPNGALVQAVVTGPGSARVDQR
jgi:flagella basal body P-ring formation protein FlgA